MDALDAAGLRQPLQPNRPDQIATQYGFWHLGRFASEYKALFGESPSTTLARA
jgi:AraC family ethanolamine operon transcriptional activator